MTTEQIHRYAPAITAISGRPQVRIREYKTYPPGQHPKECCIRNTLTALELVTDYGSRWWGCDDAYINSELRMVVVGDFKDEIRRKWKVVPKQLQRPDPEEVTWSTYTSSMD